MVDFKLHDRFPGHGKAEMPGFDDPRMDRPDRHLEYPLALDAAERVLPLRLFEDGVPPKIFLERMRALRPMLVPDEPAQIGMPLRDQAEHVADLALVPLGCMDVRRDGME